MVMSSSFYGKMAYPIGIWVQSSMIAVLSVLCNLMWTASLLAEELDEKTIEFENMDDEDGRPSLEQEKWLGQFNLLTNFIEEINNFFGYIMILTLLHTFVTISNVLFKFFRECGPTFVDFYTTEGFSEVFYPCCRLLIILIASYQLHQVKVRYLLLIFLFNTNTKSILSFYKIIKSSAPYKMKIWLAL